MSDQKLAVVAIGGNSLIRHKDHRSVEDQYRAIQETSTHLVDLINLGYQLVITHGNGPQVGFIMLRSEIAREHTGLHGLPLSTAVADTQGAIGLQIQQALSIELASHGNSDPVVTVVTQVEVDGSDSGFTKPAKPIGEFYSEDQITELTEQHPDWILMEDSNRGYRRVVASPLPLVVVEEESIRVLLAAGQHVVAAGGGGIPVVRDGIKLTSVDAVIDKDRTSALLASNLGAPLLVISTAINNVMLNFDQPDQVVLGEVSVAQMEKYAAEGHFAAGSMGPKVEAAIDFIRNGGERVIITSPENMGAAISEGAGTQIIP